MSGSRAKSSNSVSLFPFLAVLVCAMGALIFLLIVTTRRIRSEALAKAAASRQEDEKQEPVILANPRLAVPVGPQRAGVSRPKIKEPEPPQEPEQIEPIPGLVRLGEPQSVPVLPPKLELPREPEPIWPAAIAEKPAPPDPNLRLKAQLKKLEAARQAWLEHVREKEKKNAELKQRMEELTASLAKINSQIEAVAKQRLEDRKAERELQQARERIRGQIAKVEREIAQAQNRTRGTATKFQVVPFDGQTGTNYRPILIECTAQGMRFQPEGVILNEADFDGFTLGKNPLLAGAKALSDYWTRVSVRSNGQEPAPYVLLIVRPSGAKYFAAKQLLKALDQPFGYELVEENLPIEIPPLDPTAAELCRSAVESVLQERADLKRLLAAHGPEMLSRNPKYRVIKKPGGGFDVEYAPDGSPGIGGLGRDPQGGADDLPKTDRYGQPYRSRPEVREGVGDGGRFPEPIAPGPGETDPRSPRPIENGGAGRIQRNPYVDSSESRSNQVGDPSNDQLANSPGGRVPDPNEPRRLPDDIIRRSQGNLPYQQQGGGEGNLGDVVFAPAPSEPSRLDGGAGNATQPGDDPEAGQPQGSQRIGEDPMGTASTNRSDQRGNGGNPQQFDNANVSIQEQQQNNPSDPTMNPQNVSINSPASPGTANPNSAAGSPGQPGTPGVAEPPMPNFLSMNARRSLNRTEPYRRRWGYSDPRASIGFEREISVRIEANRLIVGNAFQVTYNEKSTKDELAVGMLEALELTVRKWGRPPLSFYWVPTVQFEVGPGEYPVYQLLDKTAKTWGLETSAEAMGK